MSVWLTIPSKRPPEQVEPKLKLWRERGYKIALWRDEGESLEDLSRFRFVEHIIGRGAYPGYAQAINELLKDTMTRDPKAEWFICAGDDTEPDPNHTAEEIAAECADHFFKRVLSQRLASDAEFLKGCPEFAEHATFGVMQPTGDRWGEHQIPGGHKFELWPDQPERCIHCGQGYDAPRHMVGAYIDRVCGSPWIGRQFAERMYQGNGPYWPEYTHMGVDEELQAVAVKMGVLWQRPELIHYHDHWGRPHGAGKYGNAADMPDFLFRANSTEEWYRYKRIFDERKRLGFPGHEPIA